MGFGGESIGMWFLVGVVVVVVVVVLVYISVAAVTAAIGSALTAGHFWKRAPKVTKTLLPQHSAPRLGSVCPNAGMNPWAAATRHPWRGAANPASCRVTHGFKPAFGQRV